MAKAVYINKSKQSIVLVILLASIALIMGVYMISYSTKDNVERMRDDVVALKGGFDKVSPNWKYDQYCRGVGSDISRDNRKSCYSVLQNNTDLISTNYNAYLEHLNSRGFALVRPTEILNSDRTNNKPVRISTFSSPSSKKYSCKFADIGYSDLDSTGYYFACSADSNKYYFERRD